jgi:hypothetical protein
MPPASRLIQYGSMMTRVGNVREFRALGGGMLSGSCAPIDPEKHQPIRPEWTCLVCGEAWPCPTDRQLLPQVLLGGLCRSYMQDMMFHASQDLTLAPAQMLARFVDWTPAEGTAGPIEWL